MSKKEPTNKEIFDLLKETHDAVGLFSNRVEDDLAEVKEEIAEVKDDLTSVKSKMVTKEYLDEKLGDLRGDLVELTRKEDKKLIK